MMEVVLSTQHSGTCHQFIAIPHFLITCTPAFFGQQRERNNKVYGRLFSGSCMKRTRMRRILDLVASLVSNKQRRKLPQNSLNQCCASTSFLLKNTPER